MLLRHFFKNHKRARLWKSYANLTDCYLPCGINPRKFLNNTALFGKRAP
jgi:hypothetical protein